MVCRARPCRPPLDSNRAGAYERGIMASTVISSDTIRDWLFTKALPLWSQAGLDREAGGFVESLTPTLRPNLDEPKRTRVQTRQVYVFSHTHLLGFTPTSGGPTALEAAAHGFEFFTRHFWHETDGGFVFSTNRNGHPVDTSRQSYEQAFALFAFAWYYAASGDRSALEWARRLIGWIDERLADPEHGGLFETPDRDLPRRQNPHMHYLEALLAMHEATGEPEWLERANAIVDLFRRRFLDEATGTLGEYFTPDWHPAPGEDGKILEPGHHFEWVWLLDRYTRATGEDTNEHAAALYRFAERKGRDAEPGDGFGLAFDAVDRDGRILDDRKRLWVQTEAVKAQIARRESAGDERAGEQMERLVSALFARYMGAGSGSWFDRLDRSGRPIPGDTPASSFYHVFLALSEVLRSRGHLKV